MDFLQRIKDDVQNRQISDIDHFSIENVGRKFYLYANDDKNGLLRHRIGRYNSYEEAKRAVDAVLDLCLEGRYKPEQG